MCRVVEERLFFVFFFWYHPKLLARFGEWEAHAFDENGSKVCFMASQPQKKQGNYSRRGEPFALVTHRPADNTRDVFSYITGYTYKAGSTVTVTIDDQEFKLVTQDETAWGPDADTDKKLSRAIREEVGVERNEEAIEALRRTLSGEN